MHLRRLALASAAVLFSLGAAASVDPAAFGGLYWRLIGPFRGGRVLAVSGVPDEPQHFYFGSVNGGVWETLDAGRTWQPIFDSQPIGSIGAIALAPSNPKVIYVGTGEADMRSDIAQGDGMYKSTDGGRTWSHIGLRDSQQIGRIEVHPENENLVYVAALGHPYGPNEERGVFRSSDGGKSWKKILGRNDRDTGAIDLVLEPGNPRVIYAALWQTRRTPWSVYPPSNGAGTGLFKSTDGGDTWTEIRGNGFAMKPARIGLAVAPSKPERVYAIVDAAEEGGMYRSDDRGATWTRTSSDTRIWQRGWYFGAVTVEPDDADVVYSCNIVLYRSADAGKTFTPAKGSPFGDDYHQYWIDPKSPERRILGVDQGAVVSVNRGQTWSSWYNQPTAQFYKLSTDNRFPYWVYGSQQDCGAAGVPSRTDTIDGISLMDFREVTAGGENDNVVPDPKDPQVIYGGRVERFDMRTRQTRLIDPTLATMELDRRTWTLPLVFSRRDPRVLYFANQRIFRTEDGGNHWTQISGDLTREDPGVPSNLDAATAALTPRPGNRHGVVYAIAPSRLADHDIWAGTDDGLIWRTRDEGAHWENVTPSFLTPWSKVAIIEPSPFDAQSAYAAIDRHRLDDFRPYIYRTRDGGKSWDAIDRGIPDDSFVNVVRADPVRQGLLYAGTEKGMYVSFDDGAGWQPLQLNLPVTSVRDIDVHGTDVVIGTHGRGFWILDDVTPLRQVDAAALRRSLWLVAPAAAVRLRPSGFAGMPMPKDEPLAPNRPEGAFIDYFISPSLAGQRVELEVLDTAGGLVRRYASDDEAPVANLAKLRIAPEWFFTPATLSTSAGMHRFVWPLRYPAPAELQGSSKWWANGVWAPPGSYRVVLTVGAQRLEQPLVIEADPRSAATPADYAAQFALAREVEKTNAAVAGAWDEAETLVANLRARRDAGGKLVPAIERMIVRVSHLTEAVSAPYPNDYWWLTATKTTSLRYLDSALGKLATAVDGSDGAPSTDARAGWAKLRPAADAAVKVWTSFKETELAEFNRSLAAAGEKSVEPK